MLCYMLCVEEHEGKIAKNEKHQIQKNQTVVGIYGKKMQEQYNCYR